MAGNEQSHSYFHNRADTERQMAQKAARPEAVRVHNELADRYLDRAREVSAAGALGENN